MSSIETVSSLNIDSIGNAKVKTNVTLNADFDFKSEND